MAETILLTGADTLLGRDVRERYESSGRTERLQNASLAPDASAVFAQKDDEIEVVAVLDAEMLADADVIVSAGYALETLARMREAGSRAPIIDLTGELAGEPGAALRAPLLETRSPMADIHVLPHPAAWLIAWFLSTIHEFHPVARVVANVFEPASESGRNGIDELQKQTVALLSFKKLPKEQFDAQLAFNILARTGEEAKVRLESREARMKSDLRALAALHGGEMPIASVRLVQAPVFHGYSVSLWAEFQGRVNIAAIHAALNQAGVDFRDETLDPPANAGMAGQSGYAVGAVEADSSCPNAVWFWLAADNLRLQTDLAFEVLGELI